MYEEKGKPQFSRCLVRTFGPWNGGGGGGGALGPIRNRKTGQNFHQNRKTGRKSAQNRKNAENNDQHCKFVIFNPSAVDTTAKILALGTIQCPCYTACRANLMRIIPEENFCNVQPKESLLPLHVSVSYESETFVTRDELKKVSFNAPICSQEPNNRFFVHKNRNPNVKKGKTENRGGYQNRKTGILSAKTAKPISKVTKTAKPKNQCPPLEPNYINAHQGPFLECSGNFSGPELYFKIKIYIKTLS